MHADQPTRRMTALELGRVLAAERRAVASARRAYQRTARIRVFDFKPLRRITRTRLSRFLHDLRSVLG